MTDIRFEVIADERLRLETSEPLRSMYTLSPFVWRSHGGCEVLLRAVNHSEIAAEKVARIYHGRSNDGLSFLMDEAPAIAPGREKEDRDGCEDPTVAITDAQCYVYYTGWNQAELRGRLMLASGPTCERLQKRGIALDATPSFENPKEATIAQAENLTWRLFFEFAAGDASRIGIAISSNVYGPWTIAEPPFAARADRWDNWHLSTGPIITGPDSSLMFYNGASRDAKWRIGWITFDKSYQRVIGRGADPIITPPKPKSDETDIAFAASAVEAGREIWLYYSVADKEMKRAVLRCR